MRRSSVHVRASLGVSDGHHGWISGPYGTNAVGPPATVLTYHDGAAASNVACWLRERPKGGHFDMSDQRGSSRQKLHYETIHDAYELHYFDAQSMQYRERFMLGPLLQGLDFNGLRIADFACGSGHNSLSIVKRFPTAKTVGFDISTSAVSSYRAVVGQPAFEVDLTAPPGGDGSFDAGIIVGGLHHCAGSVSDALKSIASYLKPGSPFLMVEPSGDFLLEGVRRYWYEKDRYFDAETEEALSHRRLAGLAQNLFTIERVQYLGGIGYFLVYNSLVFRIPQRLKAVISRPLMVADQIYNYLPGSGLFPYFIARWRKT